MCGSDGFQMDFAELLGYREGAVFSKMDLHTHSPASECSDFSLPEALQSVFPKNVKGTNKNSREECYNFLCSVAKGKDGFLTAYESLNEDDFPCFAGMPSLGLTPLKSIASSWLDEIGSVSSTDQKSRHDLVKNALKDISRYLKSFFFAEEFVLRCYIEELQLVALTDHNHPGYIVLRLTNLGTWFDSLCAVNRAYLASLHSGNDDAVRAVIVQRLTLAQSRLADLHQAKKATPDNDHKDRPKKLKGLTARLEHVKERLAYWKLKSNRIKPLVLLPGTEITVSNIHVLAIFPPRWFVPSRIGGILRTIGIPEEDWGRGFKAAATASVQDTLELVANANGLAIPAHSNSDHKGLLRLFKSGLALYKVLNHPALLALETTGGTVIKKKKSSMKAWESLHDLTLQNPLKLKPLCFVKNSDAHECRIELDGKGEDLGKRYTNVKLDIRVKDVTDDTPEEVFRALRLALLSGHNRIVEFPEEDGYNYWADKKADHLIAKSVRTKLLSLVGRPIIYGVIVTGDDSFADGLRLRFNPFLNCFVGNGGKSSLLRTLSYAFGAMEFMPSTPDWWLPETVTVYWEDSEGVQCLRRTGRSVDPNDPGVAIIWMRREDDGEWSCVAESKSGVAASQKILDLAKCVEIWPEPAVQNDKNKLEALKDLEGSVIDALENALHWSGKNRVPLLINQPLNLFDNRDLFDRILSRPRLKERQILWSTGSAAVPTALDAEKIIVLGEQKRGRTKKKIELICAGDFHETDVRDQMIDHFEGGWLCLQRRNLIYNV